LKIRSGPNKPNKKRADRSLDEKAEASLRKRKTTWYAHFSFNGQFFSRSLGTSDRTKAKRAAKKLISLVATGKEQRASSPAERSARQAAALRKTLALPGASEIKRVAAEKSWSPKRKITAGATQKQTWTDLNVKAARIDGIEKSWTKKRRDAAGAQMTKNMADPDFRKSRLAGLKLSNADPETKKRKSATLRKTLALPKVRRKRLRQIRKMSRTPEARAAKSKRMKKQWSDLRAAAALNVPARTKEPQKRGRKMLPGEEKEPLKIGRAIEMSIPPALRSDKKAIEAARTAYSGHLSRELCAEYHRRYRRWLKANTSPPEVSAA
jgi:hypothetical protein